MILRQAKHYSTRYVISAHSGRLALVVTSPLAACVPTVVTWLSLCSPSRSRARQVGEGDLATVKKLVASGVDVAGTANEWGETCLHLAAIPK